MRWPQWIGLALIGLAIAVLGAVWIHSPGYMDADYYFAIGRQLTAGRGFREPFLWNYLDNPLGVPHPSNLYWMPLVSVLISAPMRLFDGSFRSAQIIAIMLTVILPLLTAGLALRLHAEPPLAFQSGLLAALPGFYLPYFVTTDGFALYALIGGGICWLLADDRLLDRGLIWALMGGLAGLSHLTRADGFILLVLLGAAALIRQRPTTLRSLAALIAGYLIVMAPWWGHMMRTTGLPVNPSGGKTVWLQTYAEIFSFPADGLTMQAALSRGIGRLLSVRLIALGMNLERLVAENGLIILTPLMAIGAWELRRRLTVQIGALYLATIYLVMSLVVPLPGVNGGMFHSSAAMMPLLWALAPVGFRRLADVLARRRGWERERSRRMIWRVMLLSTAALTAYAYVARVQPGAPALSGWNGPFETYRLVGQALRASDEDVGRVAINNPPGLFAAAGLEGIVIPYGGLEALEQAVYRYGADWVVLDRNHTSDLDALYEGKQSVDWLSLVNRISVGTAAPLLIYRVDAEEGAG